jgi:hypothetical protein
LVGSLMGVPFAVVQTGVLQFCDNS